MTGSTDDFELHSSTGALTTRRALDREVVAQYILTVQAVDGEGNTGRTSYAQVGIRDCLPAVGLHDLTVAGDHHGDRCQ